MPSPTSMSRFLNQPVKDFIDLAADPAWAARLLPVFAAAGTRDVCDLTQTTRQTLEVRGASSEDLARLWEHLQYFDLSWRGETAEINRQHRALTF